MIPGLPHPSHRPRVKRPGQDVRSVLPGLTLTRKARAMADTSSSISKQPRKGPKRTKRANRAQMFDMFGQLKHCGLCKRTKSIDAFYKDTRASDGCSYKCKDCEALAAKQRIKSLTPDLRKRRSQSNIKYTKTNLRGRAVSMFNGVKTRCRRVGRICNITTDWLFDRISNGTCEKTGIKFQYVESKNGGMTPFSPSIDRINSDFDYTTDNCQVVCTMYNIGKGAHDEIDFIAMCMLVAERNKSNYAATLRKWELLQ